MLCFLVRREIKDDHSYTFLMHATLTGTCFRSVSMFSGTGGQENRPVGVLEHIPAFPRGICMKGNETK